MIGAIAGALALATLASGRTALRYHHRRTVLARIEARDRDSPVWWRRVMSWSLPSPPASVERWLTSVLAELGVDLSVSTAWTAWVVIASAAAGFGLVVGGFALAAIGLALGGIAPLVARRALAGRGDMRYETAIPDALECIAGGLRSGASLHEALTEAVANSNGVVRADLARTASRVASGVPLVTALTRWADARPLPSVRLAAAALCLGHETGGAQAQAVDGLAATVRSRLAVAAEVRALATQARTSALVIAVAPVVFGALGVLSDDRAAAFLFQSPLGLAFLGAGLGLDAVAALWMARLCRVDA
jgi:tight adherence protein B